jgi:YidC/Oxa1 family membrane protein insertase
VLLATVLSMAIVFAFMYQQNRFAAHRSAGAPDAGMPTPAASEPAPAPAPPSAPVLPPVSGPEETAVLETPEFTATFTSLGGALKSLELKGRKFEREAKGTQVPIDLVRVSEGEPYPFSMTASPEFGGNGRLIEDPAARANMRVVAKDAKSVTFEGEVGSAHVVKHFFLGEGPYEIGLDLKASAPGKGELYLLQPGFQPAPVSKPSFLPFSSGGEVVETVTPLCRAGGATERFKAKEARQEVLGTVAWVGLDQHYFLSVLLATPELGRCLFFRGPETGEQGSALAIPLDRQLDMSFKLYEGPKQLDLLTAQGRDLEKAVDYGAITNVFAFFAHILLVVMRVLQGFVKNWGIAIILLTFLVKAILYPLTAKSMQSMNEMRKLQPEIEKLKAKFGEDKEKLNMEVMKLYQAHKVNPLGGCLPMLIQMPIWFALYATLQTSVELYHEPFLWLHDLTHYDPYFILPLAMGASSFLMQRISPQPADNAQAKMLLYFMPIFFTFIMLRLPSGLTLYILVNNVLSIAQQQWLMRRQTPRAAAA